MKETGLTGKRRSTTIAATPDDGNSQRKRRRISYYDDDYDNEDSIVSDVEVEPVINLGNNQPQRDDLEEISASGHVWHDEEIASVPECPDQMKR